MKYLFLSIIVIMFSVKVDAQNTWLHVSYSWAQDDTRLFQLRHKFARKIIHYENNDDDNGTFEYSIGLLQKRRIFRHERFSMELRYGVVYTNEVQTYTKYINSRYFVQYDNLLSILDATFHRYYNKQIVVPIEISFNIKSDNHEFYLGMSSNTSFSIEKIILGKRGFGESDNLFLRRKFQFYKVSINPKIGFIIGRFDLALFWRWKQFSVFDTAIYHFSNYAASNGKAQREFGTMKYELFNPFKVGISLQFRL